jgi:REP-associated tyrosine transposase
LRNRRVVVSRPKRLPNHSYVGKAQYFLTLCVRHRRPVFKNGGDVVAVWAQIQRTAHEESFEVLAYCFVPDHLHLLVEGIHEDSNLRRFVKMSKQRSGHEYRRRCGYRLWQEGYFDRVLRDDADARIYASYIVTNPVRAGLVASAAEYEFVGTTRWTIEELTSVDSNDGGYSKITPGPKDPAYADRNR